MISSLSAVKRTSIVGLCLFAGWLPSQAALPDLATVPPDLKTPLTVEGRPAPGLRVSQTTPGWEGCAVHHTLYLPMNWKRGVRFPVLIEYAGNGGYSNRFGDVSPGTVEGSNLGYGISGGSNYLWVCMPFVARVGDVKTNSAKWWGDVGETIAYCTNTVNYLCARFGGDPKAVILCGFSRGAIACNFIGLHHDGIAPLWRAFIAHSHYDGVNTNWPYAGADRVSALARLKRLNGRPQFITHEGSTAATEAWLQSISVTAPFTFETVPFRNHSDQWVLRDLPARRKLRAWLQAQGLP
jgi:hypothetical protein